MGSNVTFATIQEYEETIIDIEENLGPQTECCIYRVPKVLRKTNEEAYTPQVISIGPLHHGEQNLAFMEKQKIRYKREFSERITSEIWEELVSFIQDHEQRIRNCYEETYDHHQKSKFVIMILYNAVFIIEFLLKNIEVIESKRNKLTKEDDIWSDLLLLENQLPYFVLENLYDIAFGNNLQYPRFIGLSGILVEYSRFIVVSGDVVKISAWNLKGDEVEFKHFTDFRRLVLTNGYSRPQCTGLTSDLRCATILQESGMKFKHVRSSESLLIHIKSKERKLCAPFQWLKVPELRIPTITVTGQTESLFRNLMAFEQCHYPKETHVCNYMYLMDRLIDTREDVNLLVDAGIISDDVGGDTAQIANMFNKLCTNINCSDDLLSCDDVKELKDYYKSPWNNAKANLKRVYFSNPWKGTATVAAIFLLLLTLVQTICSVLQVV